VRKNKLVRKAPATKKCAHPTNHLVGPDCLHTHGTKTQSTPVTQNDAKSNTRHANN